MARAYLFGGPTTFGPLLAQPAEKGKPVPLIFAHFSTGKNSGMPIVMEMYGIVLFGDATCTDKCTRITTALTVGVEADVACTLEDVMRSHGPSDSFDNSRAHRVLANA